MTAQSTVPHATLFRLLGAHRNWLGLSPDRLVQQVAPADEGAPTLWMYRPSPELGFLIAADGGSFRLNGQPFDRPFRAVLLNATARPGHLALRDALSRHFVSSNGDGSTVDVRVPWLFAWEEFEAVAVDAAVVEAADGPIGAAISCCAALADSLGDISAAAALLDSVPEHLSGATLESLLVLLNDDRAAELCRRLMRRLAPDGTGWPARLTEEPWFAGAVQALYDPPRLSAPGRVGPEWDFLGAGQDYGSFSQNSPAHRFLRHARRQVMPIKTCALLATARDEGLYLLEWIAHHRAVGVEHIFIYTNNNTDGSDGLLRVLHDAGIVTWFDNTPGDGAGLNMQRKAYAHAFSVMPQLLDYEWTLVLDLDEMFLPAPIWNNDIKPILRAGSAMNADTIAFPWLIYYPDRQLAWRDGLNGRRYGRAGANPLVKSAVRTHRCGFADAHHAHEYPDELRVWQDADGVRTGSERSRSTREIYNATICHFAMRSLEEFVWKYARGENDGHGVITDKAFRFNHPSVVSTYLRAQSENFGEPDTRYEPIAAAVEAELQRLLTLPGVADAQAVIVETYRSQVRGLVLGSVQVIDRTEALSDNDKQHWRSLVEAWHGLVAADLA